MTRYFLSGNAQAEQPGISLVMTTLTLVTDDFLPCQLLSFLKRLAKNLMPYWLHKISFIVKGTIIIPSELDMCFGYGFVFLISMMLLPKSTSVNM